MKAKVKVSDGAKIELDDAFQPTSIKFTECGKTIGFFIDGEQVRIKLYQDEDFVCSMRIPLYASVAIAQMFTKTLNGQRLLKKET